MRELPLELMFNEEAEIEKITRFIKTYLDKFGRSGVILGVSGGVDSGVVLKLLLKAVPKEKILALILPDRDTEKESISLALSLLEENDVSYKIINISPILSKFGIYRELPYWLLPTRKMRENMGNVDLIPLFASFSMVFLAELGDKTQICTVMLSSKSSAFSIF